MNVLFNDNGFEQDKSPQVCVEGSSVEFEKLMMIINLSIKNGREGDFIDMPIKDNNSKFSITFNSKKGAKVLLKRVSEYEFVVSLDNFFWENVINLIKPLINVEGYQFIEFDDEEMIEDAGLIFKVI